jgi:threonine dehydratase
MISLLDIEEAKNSIDKFINKTPIILSQFFSNLCGGNVYLKLENLQVTNSFKVRGAFNKLLNLSSKQRKKGIITASAGNHAQAIALGAEQLNIAAKIVVPNTTPAVKVDRIKKYDVELILHGEIYDEAEQMAKDLAKRDHLNYISPYNDDLIIAGQGTVGLEIFEDQPSTDLVLVPIGGGGLISGVSIALKSINPSIIILGFQSESSPVMHKSLKVGRIVDVHIKDSIADGLSGGIEKDSITFEIVQRYVDDLILVKEETIRNAINSLWKEENQVVEGAGAVAIAGLLENPQKFKGKNVVAVLSGGNIESRVFQDLTTSGFTDRA